MTAEGMAIDLLRAAENRIKNLESYNLGLANESCAQHQRIAELESQVKELSGLIYNNALGYLTMGYSVDIESMAAHAYDITGINAEGKSKGDNNGC